MRRLVRMRGMTRDEVERLCDFLDHLPEGVDVAAQARCVLLGHDFHVAADVCTSCGVTKIDAACGKRGPSDSGWELLERVRQTQRVL